MPCPVCKEISGFSHAGLAAYRVCEGGSVWTRWNGRWGLGQWRPLKGVPCKKRGGYLKVTLCEAGRQVQRYVHDLVLEAFVGPCPEGMECLHDDGDPTNNRLGNLRWGTRLENAADTRRHGRHFTPFARPPKLAKEKIAEVRRRHRAGESTRALAKVFGVSSSTIWCIVARKGVYAEGVMPCPVCSHTLQNLGVESERKFWCPRCGAVKTEHGDFAEFSAPFWTRRLLDGQWAAVGTEAVDCRQRAASGTAQGLPPRVL